MNSRGFAILLLGCAASRCLPAAKLEELGFSVGIADAPGPLPSCAVFHNKTRSCVNPAIFERNALSVEREARLAYQSNLAALAHHKAMLDMRLDVLLKKVQAAHDNEPTFSSPDTAVEFVRGNLEGRSRGEGPSVRKIELKVVAETVEKVKGRLAERVAEVAKNATCLEFQLNMAKNVTCRLVSEFGDRHLGKGKEAGVLFARPSIINTALEICHAQLELVCDLTRLARALTVLGEESGPDARTLEACGQLEALSYTAEKSANHRHVASRVFEAFFAPTRPLLLNALISTPPPLVYQLHPTGLDLVKQLAVETKLL